MISGVSTGTKPRYDPRETYLIYEPSGIADVELVFELADDLRPLRAF